jgi:hypothetical protein
MPHDILLMSFGQQVHHDKIGEFCRSNSQHDVFIYLPLTNDAVFGPAFEWGSKLSVNCTAADACSVLLYQ